MLYAVYRSWGGAGEENSPRNMVIQPERKFLYRGRLDFVSDRKITFGRNEGHPIKEKRDDSWPTGNKNKLYKIGNLVSARIEGKRGRTSEVAQREKKEEKKKIFQHVMGEIASWP